MQDVLACDFHTRLQHLLRNGAICFFTRRKPVPRKKLVQNISDARRNHQFLNPNFCKDPLLNELLMRHTNQGGFANGLRAVEADKNSHGLIAEHRLIGQRLVTVNHQANTAGLMGLLNPVRDLVHGGIVFAIYRFRDSAINVSLKGRLDADVHIAWNINSRRHQAGQGMPSNSSERLAAQQPFFRLLYVKASTLQNKAHHRVKDTNVLTDDLLIPDGRKNRLDAA